MRVVQEVGSSEEVLLVVPGVPEEAAATTAARWRRPEGQDGEGQKEDQEQG